MNTASQTWVLRIAANDATADCFALLGELAEVAFDDGSLWVRLTGQADMVLPKLACLPGDRWQATDHGLVRPGERVPELRTPDLNWQWAAELVRTTLPTIMVAAKTRQQPKLQLSLRRGGEEQACAALLTNIHALAGWVEGASEVRLKKLQWVYRQHSEFDSLVLGTPLPPVAGRYFSERSGILIPAGFRWFPHIPANDVRRVMQVCEDERLLWESESNWSIIGSDLPVMMTRAAIREQIRQCTPT